MTTIQARIDHLIGCLGFWVWSLVGAALAIGLVSLGPILLLPVFAVVVLMASNDGIRASAFGLLTGVGLVSLFIAHLHRDGSDLDPRPWLVIGLVLVAAGVICHTLRSARTGA
jgi:hypothetical protein